MTVKATQEPVAEHRADRSPRRPVRRCRCGQELDVCSRSHCPRCGASLSR